MLADEPGGAGDQHVGGRHYSSPAASVDPMRTPRPRRFQMSMTGLSVLSSRYSTCGAPMTSRSAAATTSSSGNSVASTMTFGSVQYTADAFAARMRRSSYARLDRMSSEPPLNAMPRMPTDIE